MKKITIICDENTCKEVLIRTDSMIPNDTGSYKRTVVEDIKEEKEMGNKVEVKLGEQRGCMFDDTIFIELSPYDVECIANLCEEKSMCANTYVGQGSWRELKDRFQEAYTIWGDARDKKMRREDGSK